MNKAVAEEAPTALEIERKFLVAELPDLAGLESVDVAQGYLTHSDDSVEIRLRKKAAGGTANYFMTLKSDGALERKEIEVAVSAEQFESFWPATMGRQVEKTRYVGALGDGLHYELDVFHGGLKGLLLVEVEFPSVEAANSFVAPDWFGADVTSNKGYKNKALAVKGMPKR
ncbi:CYTH domain-containing protein [uncultured Cohaesibacter sp.]|uniref:CYTH domain-containing protein n=1 Tax=uncultured Cohaesibacter sp. TaxID=1002546 RepID=UPI002AABCADE|nr:CYTH domain-containing protein [uncultured Cohaesibacter sp.]